MRAFSWVMVGIGIGVGLTNIWMKEHKEPEARLPTERTGGRADEEWPLGKSFETKPRSEENLGSFAGAMEE